MHRRGIGRPQAALVMSLDSGSPASSRTASLCCGTRRASCTCGKGGWAGGRADWLLGARSLGGWLHTDLGGCTGATGTASAAGHGEAEI